MNMKKKGVSPVLIRKEPQPSSQGDRYDMHEIKVTKDDQEFKVNSKPDDDYEEFYSSERHAVPEAVKCEDDFVKCENEIDLGDESEVIDEESLDSYDNKVIEFASNDEVRSELRSENMRKGFEQLKGTDEGSGKKQLDFSTELHGVVVGLSKNKMSHVKFADMQPENDDEGDNDDDEAGLDEMVTVAFENELY